MYSMVTIRETTEDEYYDYIKQIEGYEVKDVDDEYIQEILNDLE